MVLYVYLLEILFCFDIIPPKNTTFIRVFYVFLPYNNNDLLIYIAPNRNVLQYCT